MPHLALYTGYAPHWINTANEKIFARFGRNGHNPAEENPGAAALLEFFTAR